MISGGLGIGLAANLYGELTTSDATVLYTTTMDENNPLFKSFENFWNFTSKENAADLQCELGNLGYEITDDQMNQIGNIVGSFDRIWTAFEAMESSLEFVSGVSLNLPKNPLGIRLEEENYHRVLHSGYKSPSQFNSVQGPVMYQDNLAPGDYAVPNTILEFKEENMFLPPQ